MALRKRNFFFPVFKKAFNLFVQHNGPKLSASLSYYTVFSIGPLLLIIISLTGIFFGREAVEGKVYGQIKGLIGGDAALQVQQIIQNIRQSKHSTIGSIIGIVVLILGASGVFSEIQDSINYIWELKPKPKKGWLLFVIKKLLSFSLLLGMGFILLVSLIAGALIDVLSDRFIIYFPGAIVESVYIINIVLIFTVNTCLFTMIFKILPNAIITWKDAVIGAIFTSILFLTGKFMIGFYLGNSRIGITYGTATSIVVLMLWVYYSSIILYFGAAFTRAYAQHFGRIIRTKGG